MTTANRPSSRSAEDREPLTLDYAPALSQKYSWQFLEAACSAAFLPLEQQIARLNEAAEKTRLAQETARKNNRSSDHADLSGNLAALLLLRDLLQMGWRMKITGPLVQLYQLPTDGKISEAKAQIRQSMTFERREVLYSSAVQAFVRYMERPRLFSDEVHSILSVVADGRKLHSKLALAAQEPRERRPLRLKRAVKPYLQLVEGDERDQFTGLRLMDIWRYFRLTWSIPHRSNPGRNLFYLVRDAGQPNHPVMGIAALANCVIGLKCRDDHIGWTADALALRIRRAKEQGDTELRKVTRAIADLLEAHLESGLSAISIDGIATKNAIRHPTPEAVEAIQAVARDAAEERYEHLRREAQLVHDRELLLVAPGAPAQPLLSREQRRSSQALFRRKRASKLARLLEAKLVCQAQAVFENPIAGVPDLLWTDKDWKSPSEHGRSAIRTILNANKESKIGTAMMEIVVCGAVPPYNHLLGGKLVAMLLTSPEVVRDYEQRYGQQASTIASQVAGCDVTHPAHLVYLGTSSLYAGKADKLKPTDGPPAGPNGDGKAKTRSRPSSASQYNRICIPASIVRRTGSIRYEYLGVTEGFGVVHFSTETCKALEALDMLLHNTRRVNSMFGEGTSPRMRKIRQGISLLGLDDRFLVHGQSRLVYGVNLAHNTQQYLTGKEATPQYIWRLVKPEKTTKAIANYWLTRWLSSRLDHAPALEALAVFDAQQTAVSLEYGPGGPSDGILLELASHSPAGTPTAGVATASQPTHT